MDEFRNDNDQFNNIDEAKNNPDDGAVNTVHQADGVEADAAGSSVHDSSPEAGVVSDAANGSASAGEDYIITGNPGQGPESFGGQATGMAAGDGVRPPYYSESIKKTRQKRIGAGHLILVSVLSSLLGAAIMFAAVVYIAPMRST